MRKTATLITLAGLTLVAACHSAPPPEAAAPQPSPADIALHQHVQDSLDAVNRATADSVEQARLVAVAASARADSIENARLALAAQAAREVAAQNEQLRNELGTMVHFTVGQARIQTEDRSALDRKVAILKANPMVRLRITGATDARGSDQYNVALGERRAASVKRYLIDQGIDVTRLEEISTGETSPIDSGTGEAAWAQNRRAEFMVVSGDMPLAMN